MEWIVILNATSIQIVAPSYTGYLSTSLAGIMRDIATEHQIFLALTDNNTPALTHVVMTDGSVLNATSTKVAQPNTGYI